MTPVLDPAALTDEELERLRDSLLDQKEEQSARIAHIRACLGAARLEIAKRAGHLRDDTGDRESRR